MIRKEFVQNVRFFNSGIFFGWEFRKKNNFPVPKDSDLGFRTGEIRESSSKMCTIRT